MKRCFVVIFAFTVVFAISAQTVQGTDIATYSYKLISKVMEANPRVVAAIIDFEKELPLNWDLSNAFEVTAELLPVKNYAGDIIANSAVSKSPRNIVRAYTSAVPEIGKPRQGRYVVIEFNPYDSNASSWYFGFNPGIRQAIDYGNNMVYEVKLKHDLNYLTPDITSGKVTKPSPSIQIIKQNSVFRLAGTSILYADEFINAMYTDSTNPTIKSIGYNFYAPKTKSGEKMPLVLFLHGSGQSHDYINLSNNLLADVKSPLLANQGGVAWIENGKERCFVLVPQMPARDTKDPQGRSGWINAETQKLLVGLLDMIIEQNPNIDKNRIYLTGLSMGGQGSWGLIMDPEVSDQFAAAVICCGMPSSFLSGTNYEIISALASFDYSNTKLPLWLFHCDTDLSVNVLGSRVPFATLSGKAAMSYDGSLIPFSGVLKKDNGMLRYYEATNKSSGADLRYTELQFGNGDKFLDFGMVTQIAHFVWEYAYKDRQVIDWLFSQSK